MACLTVFACSACARTVSAWSDGNPYFLDADGRKRYAYHPDHGALARCIGNDTPHLCTACGAEQVVDSRTPRSIARNCAACGAAALRPCTALAGTSCPTCRAGIFAEDVTARAIS